MSLSLEIILIFLIVVGFTLYCAFLIWKIPKVQFNRTKILEEFLIFAGSFFSIGLVLLFAFLPGTLFFMISWVIYDFLISFVVFIEIPAYLRISKYDDDFIKVLKELRGEIIKVQFEPESSIIRLKKKRSDYSSFLKEESFDELLQDFILACENMGNFNENLWSLTLNEISELVEDVTKRSKHPFPKLIDILALSGLSVLLAQFLKLIG